MFEKNFGKNNIELKKKVEFLLTVCLLFCMLVCIDVQNPLSLGSVSISILKFLIVLRNFR